MEGGNNGVCPGHFLRNAGRAGRAISLRTQATCPANISVLSFFADNLAWAMACPPLISYTKE